MTGNPLPFHPDEKNFILQHIGPGPGHLSWGDIARELNRLFPQYNQGRRHRMSVQKWVKEFTCRYGERINTR